MWSTHPLWALKKCTSLLCILSKILRISDVLRQRKKKKVGTSYWGIFFQMWNLGPYELSWKYSKVVFQDFLGELNVKWLPKKPLIFWNHKVNFLHSTSLFFFLRIFEQSVMNMVNNKWFKAMRKRNLQWIDKHIIVYVYIHQYKFLC